MSDDGVKKLKIFAYQKFESGSVSGPLGTYELQLNPASVSCTYAKVNPNEDRNSATGDPLNLKRPTYYREAIKFNFTLDHSGALPFAADGLTLSTAGTTGLKQSIEKLRAATIMPLRSTHAPPFIKVIWGDIALQGIVQEFSIDYTYFNVLGEPLRAKVTLGVIEVVDAAVESSKYQSPDITRMPIIKAGENLPQLCNEFYDSPQYYIQVARENGLSSFRRLKPGEVLRFPPLEK